MSFYKKVDKLFRKHEKLIARKNIMKSGNGVCNRFKYPVVTAKHTPIFWRYDLDRSTNPMLLERIGVNATMNSGAIKFGNRYCLVVRVEGVDRKGGESERSGQLPVPRLPDHHAGDRQPRHQRLRHASDPP